MDGFNVSIIPLEAIQTYSFLIYDWRCRVNFWGGRETNGTFVQEIGIATWKFCVELKCAHSQKYLAFH